MRTLIVDGPHRGIVQVDPAVGSVLHLADPGSSALRPYTRQRYVRETPHPDDFLIGIEARFRWDP